MFRHHAAADKPGFLAEHGAAEVRAIATSGGTGAAEAVIDACPRLQIVSVYGVGYDRVALDACRARGIAVTNTPDVLTEDCADLAVDMVLALGRGIVPAEA